MLLPSPGSKSNFHDYTLIRRPGRRGIGERGLGWRGHELYHVRHLRLQHYFGHIFLSSNNHIHHLGLRRLGGSISPSGAATVTSGSSQSYTITPASGYNVAAVTVDGTSAGAVSSYTFSNVTANHTISATFTAATYTITATAGSNGSISPSGAATVTSGSGKTYTITPSSGYSVANVTVDGASAGAVSSYTFSNVTANHTISATFTAATYTITATAGSNGSISPSGAATVTSGSGKTYTITPSSGYSVANVTVDGASAGAVSSYMFSNVTANHTISATFTAATYTITATAGSNGSISPSGAATVTSGSSKTYTITPSSGYSVANVTVDGASAGALTSYTFSGVTANHSISATFALTNAPPVADAGPNQTVAEGTKVTLNGSNSTNPGGSPLTSYQWLQTGGPTVNVSNASITQPTITAPSKYTGALTFEFIVKNGNGLTASATSIVNVISKQLPPTAYAGVDQTVTEGKVVTLNGSGSTDPNGCTLTCLWNQIDGPTVTLSSTASSKPTFSAPQTTSGFASMCFQLTVTDKYGLESTDICYVNISRMVWDHRLSLERPKRKHPAPLYRSTERVQQTQTALLSHISGTRLRGALRLYRLQQRQAPILP